MSNPGLSIFWFRRDLRLEDNPGLFNAYADWEHVLPVYIWDPQAEKPWEPGAASKWWLHHSLAELKSSLEKKGGDLIIRAGQTMPVLEQLIQETKARAVYFSESWEFALRKRDQEVVRRLNNLGVKTSIFNSSLLLDPRQMKNSSGGPYRVFTPFWNCLRRSYDPPEKYPSPKSIKLPAHIPASVPLESLSLLPRINWSQGLEEHWQPGEKGAKRHFSGFCQRKLYSYESQRDVPGDEGTSRLSPHIHFGEISVQSLWRLLVEQDSGGTDKSPAEPFLRQVAWREFAAHLLFHFPQTDLQPLRPEFSRFPWRKSKSKLLAWEKGESGYPIVDAGMRELWHTGWMHNRVRMITASFLVKDLLQPWQEGAKWFWDTLVDADLANNTFGWQWVSGCGADAAPYFRIFNPVLQSKKFDSRGEYLRRWIPELGKLPNRWIHEPSECPVNVLKEAGVVLGKTYPRAVVNHREAARSALDAYDELR